LSTAAEERQHEIYLRVVLGAGIVLLWIVPTFSSYWLDETITSWVVQGGFGEMLHRAFDHQPMFPTYYVVAWAAKTLGGQREWVLRLPSLLAMGLGAAVLARLGTRLFDRETGLLAAIVFGVSFQGTYAAVDARPYALAILGLVVATYLLVRWLDTGRPVTAAAYAVAAAFVVYVHYLFAPALLAHALYAFRRRRSVGTAAMVVLALTFLVLLLPLVPWFVDTYGNRSILSSSSGTTGRIAATLAPAGIVAAITMGAFFAGRALRVQIPGWRTGRDEIILLVSWAAIPPVALFAASRLAGAGVFTSRYLLSSLPALALLVAAAVRTLGPPKARRILMAVFMALSIVFLGTLAHTSDGGGVQDWRGAAEAVNALVEDPGTPVVLASGLIETERVELLNDPAWVPYLLAPAAAYPIDGTLVPAPFGLSDAERAYLEDLTTRLLDTDRFLIVVPAAQGSVFGWFEGRFVPEGFVSAPVGRFGEVQVTELARPS
jgi:mannosyltransferase